MMPCSFFRHCAVSALAAILSASGCSGPPPGGIEDYQKKVLSAEQALKEQGASLKQKTFALNQVAWTVDLSGKEIKPEILAELQKLDGIGELILKEAKITDEQMQSLAKLAPLYVLNLSNTGVTDAGIKHLTQNTISELDVSGTKVSADAVAAMKKRYATDPAVNEFFKKIKIKQ